MDCKEEERNEDLCDDGHTYALERNTRRGPRLIPILNEAQIQDRASITPRSIESPQEAIFRRRQIRHRLGQIRVAQRNPHSRVSLQVMERYLPQSDRPTPRSIAKAAQGWYQVPVPLPDDYDNTNMCTVLSSWHPQPEARPMSPNNLEGHPQFDTPRGWPNRPYAWQTCDNDYYQEEVVALCQHYTEEEWDAWYEFQDAAGDDNDDAWAAWDAAENVFNRA